MTGGDGAVIDPRVYLTVNIRADTPMGLEVGMRWGHIKLGPLSVVTLEFVHLAGLERLRDLAVAGVTGWRERQSATGRTDILRLQSPDPAGDDVPAAGAR